MEMVTSTQRKDAEDAGKKNYVASPKSMADYIQDFGDNTSMHGVFGILRIDQSRQSRFVWAVITLFAFSVLLYQGSYTVINFFERPTTSKISLITMKKLVFPSITICNLNMMRRSKLNGTRFEGLVALDEKHAHLQEASSAEESRNNDDFTLWRQDFASSSSTDSSELYSLWDSSWEYDYRRWEDVTDPDDWESLYNMSKMSDLSDLQAEVKPTREELNEYGHRGEDLIQQCTFDTKPCSYKNFTKIQDIRYGNCYVFNEFKKSAVETRNTGSQSGLHLTLFVEEPEYIGVASPETGVVVAINHPSIFPFPEDDGILVSTGQVASIGLKRTYIARLPEPYGDCGKGSETYYAPDRYDFSQRSCHKMCLERETLKQCNCVTDILVNATMCSPVNRTQWKCRADVFKKHGMNSLGCMCGNPCSQNVYNARISTARWPSERYEEHLYMRLSKNERAEHFLRFKDQAGKNLVRLKIYFEELNFERVEEAPFNTVSSLFGNIGGLMGLYMGMSVITGGEILVFIFQIVRSVWRKRTWLR